MTFRLLCCSDLFVRLLLLKCRMGVYVRRMNTRPALGPCVSLKVDEDTHLKLLNAKERSGRSKAGEIVVRIKDHLSRFPDFYPTVTYKNVSFGPVVTARFDDATNMKLIAAKNKSNRSKSHEVFLRLQHHLEQFPDFYNSEIAEEMKIQNR